MADTHESGMQIAFVMQIVTGMIELAKKAMESRRALEIFESEPPYWILSSETSMLSLGAFVDCLSSVSKSVFEHDKGRYLTTTLFTFLLQRPPTQLYSSSLQTCFPTCDYVPEEMNAWELETSEFHIKKIVGLLGLISLYDACMSLPPLPLHKFSAKRLDDVATLLYYLDIRGPDLVRLLLNLLIEGTTYDKLISVMALGAIAQRSGEVKHLVEAGVMGMLSKILKQGPMVLQAEVAHVISKFVAIDRTIHDKLPLFDLIGSLLSHLLFMATEKNFQDDINKTASAFSMAAASRTSNSRKIADDRKEKSPEVKARMVATINMTLRILVKNDSSLCWTIIEGLKDEALSLRCLGIDEAILTTGGRDQVPLLLNTLRGGGSLYDKWISVMVLGAVAQQTSKREHLVEAGGVAVFTKILKEGPMLLQAEVSHVMSICVAIDPEFRDKLPQDDVITSLISLLQVEVAEEHLQDDITKATSVLSIVAARHNSNRRKVAAERNEKSMSGEHNQPQQEVSPQVSDRIRETAARALGALAKDNAPACHIIVEKRATLCFAVLLQNGRLDVKLSSAMALMEITAVAEKESDLRRSGFKHSSYAHKTVVDQLMRIIREALDVKSGMHSYVTAELLIPCIKTIGNLAATFRVTQPIIPLVHLLGSSNYRESINNYEIIKETLAALSKFACRDHSFLHLDHSKAIVSLGGLYRILLLAEHEDIGVEKHALVLLCYVAVDALGNESDELKKVVSAINIASRKGHFSKDEAGKALLQQTKRRLGQLMLG